MLAEVEEGPRALLGEGPQLFPDGHLRWVDLLRGDVYIRASGRSRLFDTHPHEVSKVLPWSQGHLVLARAGIAAVTSDGVAAWSIDLTIGDQSLRCSDGTVLPNGSIAVGIVDRDLTPGRGRLVVVHGDGSVDGVVEGATIPNGIDVTVGGDEVLWIDSPTRTVMRLRIDARSGRLGPPRDWVTLPEEWGVPDGLCTDDSGGAWIAMWGGARVVHVDSGGEIDTAVEVSVDHVTSVAFDADDALIITTASVALSESDRAATPGAGSLWRVLHPAHRTRGLPPRISTLAPRRKAIS